jgi:TRAP-type mannitol/chloroaromatic compound transport system permease large subunit
MSVELITVLMFALLLVLICTGLPLVFCLGFSAVIFTLLLWGPSSLIILTTAASGYMNNFVLLCIPLFIFMAHFLEKSGIADNLYRTMHFWFGPLNGGLAIGTVFICTIFAAMTGVTAAGALKMGLVALPNMLKRGYNKSIACGCILSGGALVFLFPPASP